VNTDGSFEPHPAFPHINSHSRPAPVAADDHPLRYADEQHDVSAAYQAKHRQPFTHADATSVTDSRGRVAARAARRPGR
jgi:hypothetical protein